MVANKKFLPLMVCGLYLNNITSISAVVEVDSLINESFTKVIEVAALDKDWEI